MILDYDQLLLDILDFDPDRRRCNHLLKVTSYAMTIAGLMQMQPTLAAVLRTAAMLHDIGIKPSLEKFNSDAGSYQQQEGPDIAAAMLEKYHCSAVFIDRIKYLIAHHHDYAHIDGDDYQILVEADFLVNCDEGNMEKDAILSVREKIFRTAPGTDLMNRLFDL
ncbi:MAG: HD domain-containing protein [Planctomycetes bacterium]|nr:HD domain-containing protein [Planctomycetota bacterium]